MLALYHLFSDAAPGELAGIDEVLKQAREPKLNGCRYIIPPVRQL
jgi:hypothetical protein